MGPLSGTCMVQESYGFVESKSQEVPIRLISLEDRGLGRKPFSIEGLPGRAAPQ